jgi:hypothetical protein
VDGQGKEVQAHICRAFEADVIIVIGDDRLHSAMQAAFQVLDQSLISLLLLSASVLSVCAACLGMASGRSWPPPRLNRSFAAQVHFLTSCLAKYWSTCV